MSNQQRLDKWLSNLGIGSRKSVRGLIFKGSVTVNDVTITSPDTKVGEDDHVVVDGTPLSLKKYVYYMMNKPSGVLSATRDRHAKTVIDLLPETFQRPGLFPAGRLDKDTEGLLLITNDGIVAHEILGPKKRVSKTYEAVLNHPFDPTIITHEFGQGVKIGDGDVTSPAQLTVVSMGDNPTVQLTIYEGMFHQVKRMFRAFGLEVVFLKRTEIGGLSLDPSLKLGESRELTPLEVENILII